MTVVIGAVVNKKVYLAGDSFCGGENTVDLCRDPKVVKVSEEVALGLCGDVRAERLVIKAVKSIFSRRKKAITKNWLEGEFSAQLHNRLKNSGVLRDDKGIHHLEDSNYILAHDGHIYYLDSNLALWESRYPYVAIGAASDGALTALSFSHLTGQLQKSPRETLEKILQATASHSVWVYEPFTFLEL